MLNYSLIFFILILVIVQFRRGYASGVCASVFFLIAAPSALTINLGIVLPAFTIHRLVMITWFIHWLTSRDVSKSLRGIPFLPILLCTGVAAGIAVLFANNVLVSAKRYLYFLFESLIFFVLLITTLKGRMTVDELIKSVVLALLVVAIIGIIQRYTGIDLSSYMGERSYYEFETIREQRVGDVTSTYHHRIHFGTGMAIGMMYLLIPDLYFGKLLRWISFILVATAWYFSLSRGPWLSFFVSGLIMSAIAPKVILKKMVVIAFLGLAFFVIRPGTFYTIESLFRSTGDSTTLKGSSYLWRFQVWGEAIARTANSDPARLLFGHGGGSHMYEDQGTFQLSSGHTTIMQSWDSEFAIILFERGFVGFVLLALLYLQALLKGFKYFLSHEHNERAMLLALSSILIIIFMKTNVAFFSPQLVYLENVNLAIISALCIARKADGDLRVTYGQS